VADIELQECFTQVAELAEIGGYITSPYRTAPNNGQRGTTLGPPDGRRTTNNKDKVNHDHKQNLLGSLSRGKATKPAYSSQLSGS